MPQIIAIPAFADNYIWMLRKGRQAVVVDPGDAAPVQAVLAREGLVLTAILATHHHRDHVGGIPALLKAGAIPVYGPARETIPGRTVALADGDRVALPELGVTLKALDVPGHTAGHIALFGDVAGLPSLFCGDTLFAAGCGRLFEGTADEMWRSLSRLAALPPATRIYCGHEYTLANLRFAAAVEPDNAAIKARLARDSALRDRGVPTLPAVMADELATNPFLRAELPAVQAIAAARAGHALADATASFAVLREWKNRF